MGKNNLEIKLTHPDKIFYAEDRISKQQLFDYYKEFQSLILPFIVNRPLTLVRCPDNYTKCFYQKHLSDKTALPELHSIRIREKEKYDNYIYISDIDGLLALTQLGVLEIHPWESTINSLNKPDILIFDLDPDTDIHWNKVVKTAFEFKNALSELKIKSFVKTTGGKGLHIVVPIIPEFTWKQIKEFSKSLCEYVMLENPSDYTLKMRKSERKGKIYLDYLRNQKGATAIAPYSTRARKHAPVATPIAWDELTKNIRDTQFTIKTIPDRLRNLKKDPWQDFYKIEQSLPLNLKWQQGTELFHR